MNEQIKQIAERLRGLRDVLDLTPEEVAESCQMPVETYLEMESGNKDISVSALQQIARKYDVSLDVLMFGEEPKMSSYFLTRKGAGVSVERTKLRDCRFHFNDVSNSSHGPKSNPIPLRSSHQETLRSSG